MPKNIPEDAGLLEALTVIEGERGRASMKVMLNYCASFFDKASVQRRFLIRGFPSGTLGCHAGNRQLTS
ncbi:hypothetical protein [Bythopirellula polymerisocia]|nr:hypothetical protein [Bythopirellula polymerisocia]